MSDTFHINGQQRKQSRRIQGQRRKGADRRRANVNVANCRRKNTHDRRIQADRRPRTDSQVYLKTVPAKLKFVIPNDKNIIGSIINISA